MVYAMPAVSGYLTESDVNLLLTVINKAFKLEYLSSIPDLRSLISRADRQLFNKLNTNPSIVLLSLRLLSATWKLIVQHFAPGVIVSVCHSAKVNCSKMRILIAYYSCIFNFNLFHFMFLLFRRALYKVADVNF